MNLSEPIRTSSTTALKNQLFGLELQSPEKISGLSNDVKAFIESLLRVKEGKIIWTDDSVHWLPFARSSV